MTGTGARVSAHTAVMSWVFVYGSLRTGGGAEALLRDAVVERRPAVLPGHALYGRHLPYPSAAPDPGSTVLGEAIRLDEHRAADLLSELDAYEGDGYLRIRQAVSLDEEEVVADLWVAARRPAEDERIPSGDWFRRDL